MSNPQVELHIAGHGVITLELDQDKAPKSVANFLNYVNKGHYDNTVFHRVSPDFMVQGGGFAVGMKQKLIDDKKLSAFGWKYKTTIADGIRQTYDYFMNEVRRG